MSEADAAAADPDVDDEPAVAVPRPPRLPGWALAVAGLVGGVVLGAAVIWVAGSVGRSDEVETFRPLPGVTATLRPTPAAADALVDAMRRSRRATYALVEDFVRVAPNGVEVVATRTARVQRPPDSLVRTDTSVDLVVAGKHTACATAVGAPGMQCRSEPAVAVDVESTVAEQATLVRGRAPLYTVASSGPGCFALVLRVERTAPPYGRRATLCFDGLTGAPASSEITKSDGNGGEIVDRTTATDIRPTVGDGDLALPPGVTG